MQQACVNTVRVYTVPPTWLLDMAAEYGLLLLVGVPWPQHIAIQTRKDRLEVLAQVQNAVRQLSGHPAVLGCLVGNEIPASLIRWYGKIKSEKLLYDLYDAAKQVDPGMLVSYANYPSTEYLELPFLDFQAFNLYLHERRNFHIYLAKLQNMAGSKPLVISEFGLDSRQHGSDAQASYLDWQTQEIFQMGCAGAVAYAWTDEWFRNGRNVDEWLFGIVDRERQPKPAYHAMAHRFAQVPFGEQNWPWVSVVIAVYNGASTLDDCLNSLVNMHYPNYEVLVVDDGSNDGTDKIADRYAAKYPQQVRAIHTPNGGLSVARNIGIVEATGHIVAYTDADCRVDPDWLYYFAARLMQGDITAVGGPNLVPADDGWIAQCVGLAPGGPTHILTNDELAEHIPGCNMAFWKNALEEVGGFQPVYRVAGDDVDLCWRLQAIGHHIGFAPGAVVWHHRRPSIRAYLKQQIGYGQAEAILERDHPEKFNGLGQIQWSGRIYGLPQVLPFSREARIYQGVFGSAGFQSLYHPTTSSWVNLPQMPEWYILTFLFLVLSRGVPWAGIAGLAMLCITARYACKAGFAADLPGNLPRKEELKYKGTIALLHFLYPLVRMWGRLKGGLKPFRLKKGSATSEQDVKIQWRHLRAVLWPWGEFETAFWSQNGQEHEDFLRRLISQLNKQHLSLSTNNGWDPWDLLVERGISGRAYLFSAIEYHGGPKRLLRLRVKTKIMSWATGILVILAILSLGTAIVITPLKLADWVLDLPSFVLLCLWICWLGAQRIWLAASILATAEQLAQDLGLIVLSQP
ncbi:MAG: glycosyltransferase [Chloroflexi bacterium]|nr:glycosyltransferase [Chloroflexota bacterium]